MPRKTKIKKSNSNRNIYFQKSEGLYLWKRPKVVQGIQGEEGGEGVRKNQELGGGHLYK